MKKLFLQEMFKKCYAPELDGAGNIVRKPNGAPNYVRMPKADCLEVARKLSGGKLYKMPWMPDVEADSLFCLDPNDPTADSWGISKFHFANLRYMERLTQSTAKCPYFGTGLCDCAPACCDGCADTTNCDKCKKRCAACSFGDMCRVMNIDIAFEDEDGNVKGGLNEIKADDDTAREVENAEGERILSLAFDELGKENEKGAAVLKARYIENKTVKETANECGYASTNSVAKKEQKSLQYLRDFEPLKNYFQKN